MDDFTPSPQRRSIFDRAFRYLDNRRPSDRFLLMGAILIFLVAGALSLVAVNDSFSETVPTNGGTFTEGVLGTPRFINPALAITQADHDLVALLYRGLTTLNADGTVENDLAESVTVSDDGTTYNVVLRDDIEFTDGEAIQADDVIFTLNLIQDSELKSPARGNWNGVTIEPISETEFNLVLEEAYTPFAENLTTGIMPKHIWEQLSIEELPFSQHNIEPVGSGPYQIENIERSQAGLVEAYKLSAVDSEATNITTVRLRFYQNQADIVTALNEGIIDATASLNPSQAARLESNSKFRTIAEPLPRIFTVFINQNRSAALRDQAAREALSAAIDRQALVDTVLNGYAVPTTSPVPTSFDTLQSSTTDEVATSTDTLETAKAILEAGDWEQLANGRWVKDIADVETELAISFATANTAVFEATANYLETAWSELGVSVNAELFEQTDLVQSVIRPRDYQALLFGVDVGRKSDLYPFWHSSERSDPGLNVALYTNITTDELLDRSRTEQDPTERRELLGEIASEITTETPAIFLYSPAFVYVVNDSVTTIPTLNIATASDRFATIQEWYMSEEKLWPAFR